MKQRSLLVLGACFAVALLGRAGVLASDLSERTADKAGGKAATTEDATSEPTYGGGGKSAQCLTAETAAAVGDRIAKLDEREAALAEREAEATVYARQVEKRLAELNEANAALEERLAALDARKSADVQKLASIYNNMKPALAGEIIAGMDPVFAAGLLSQMDDERAAGVIAAMDPAKAYAVSLTLANRSQR